MTRANVSATRDGDNWTLVFVRTLRHDPVVVWEALTDREILAHWAPFEADHDLDQRGPAVFTMIDGATRMDGPAEVRIVKRPTLLEYTWGEDLLRWEVEPIDGGTRLTLRHSHGNRDWLPKLAAGWDICVGVAAQFLDGAAVTPIRGQDALNHGFADLEQAYAEDLGFDLS